MIGRTEDGNWLRGVFGLSPMARSTRDKSIMEVSVENYKFSDTSIGGNQAINPPPQFTRFADPKSAGFLSDRSLGEHPTSLFINDDNSGSFRQGRTYSKVIDDNATYVHMRFGMAKPTGSFNFFANMHDRDLAKLATTGDYTSLMRGFGQVAGMAGLFMVLPSVIFFPLILTGSVLSMISEKAPSKFFYLKPTQNLYLQAVQAILDTQLLHHRLVPMWNVIGTNRYNDITKDDNVLQSTMEEVYSELPDIWKSNGKFDVFKMVNRYQVLANYQHRTLEEIYNKAIDATDYTTKLNEYINKVQYESLLQDQYRESPDLYTIAKKYSANTFYQESADDAAAHDAKVNEMLDMMSTEGGVTADGITAQSGVSADPVEIKDTTTFGSFMEGLKDVAESLGSEAMDGSMWITVAVNGKGSVSDSISSSVTAPTIASALNSISSKARSINASTSGGKTGFSFIDEVVGGIKDFIGGTLDTLHLTGLSAVFGRSDVVIGDIWESSDTNIGTQTYTMQCRSPHGNDLALFQNIMVPLSFIVAGSVPLSTGKQTYTSPFLVEIYSAGRTVCRMGIIDSVTITRGVGNKGWRSDGRMLGCDIEFTVKPIDKKMHMPIVQNPGIFDDDNLYTDYMATIGASSLRELTYSLEQTALNVNKWKQSWKSRFSAGRIANDISQNVLFQAVQAVSRGISR